MKEVLQQARYWGRAAAAGLYVVVIELTTIGHIPTAEEAWIPFLKGLGAFLVVFGANARTRAR